MTLQNLINFYDKCIQQNYNNSYQSNPNSEAPHDKLQPT